MVSTQESQESPLAARVSVGHVQIRQFSYKNCRKPKTKRNNINIAAMTKMVPDLWMYLPAGLDVLYDFSLAALIDDAILNRRV
jgi:hypothetical protein